MLDEDDRRGPTWAWDLQEILDDARVFLALTALTVTTLAVLTIKGGPFLVRACDPLIVPVTTQASLFGAVLAGTLSTGVGLGFALGRA